MRYFLDLVLHYIKANSRHGTHSPFVYRFADRVVYPKLKFGRFYSAQTKQEALLVNIRTYFVDVEGLSVVEFDACFTSVCDILNALKENSVVIVRNIYLNDSNKKKWSALLADQNVVVSIDLFYFGIIMNRKEQLKENFKLRFPY